MPGDDEDDPTGSLGDQLARIRARLSRAGSAGSERSELPLTAHRRLGNRSKYATEDRALTDMVVEALGNDPERIEDFARELLARAKR